MAKVWTRPDPVWNQLSPTLTRQGDGVPAAPGAELVSGARVLAHFNGNRTPARLLAAGDGKSERDDEYQRENNDPSQPAVRHDHAPVFCR
jgi:hypothetical protein